MKEADDEEPTRWTSIGWQAALITNRLRCQAQLLKIDEQKNEGSEGEKDSSEGAAAAIDDRRAFVDMRVRELREFEQRIRQDRLRRKFRRP
jgi:hypothetical protein